MTRIPNSHPNPSGDPRLDPNFQRKNKTRSSDGFLAVPTGKAHPTRVYTFDNGRSVKTKARSRYLIVYGINGYPVILHRCRAIEKATEIVRNRARVDEWGQVRVIDQKTREILWLPPGEKELVTVGMTK